MTERLKERPIFTSLDEAIQWEIQKLQNEDPRRGFQRRCSSAINRLQKGNPKSAKIIIEDALFTANAAVENALLRQTVLYLNIEINTGTLMFNNLNFLNELLILMNRPDVTSEDLQRLNNLV